MLPLATPCGVERMRDRVKKRAASKWAFVTAINGGDRLRGSGPAVPVSMPESDGSGSQQFFPFPK